MRTVRRHWLSIAVAGTVLCGSAGASEPGEVAASQVSEASYRYFLGDDQGVEGILRTHAGHNRGLDGPEHDIARDNIAAQFDSFGLTVELEVFDRGENVVATQLGTLYPDQEYIIGAHYDSANNPGADDNASGVALVLETARILSQYPSERTIRYIAFDAEEVGLVGSEAYVDAHLNDDILGMISTDMVAYNTGLNSADIWGRSASSVLKHAVADAVATYGDGLASVLHARWDASDHVPFELAGFEACLFTEDWGNPNYHHQTDNVDEPNYIDYAYAVTMTRSITGFLVDAAGVQVFTDYLAFDFPDGPPVFIAPEGGTTMRVVVSGVGGMIPQPGTGMFHYYADAAWQSTPMTVVAENVYDAVFPSAPCGDELWYYVSAQATDGTPFSSPFNAPATWFTTRAAQWLGTVWEHALDEDPGWTTEGEWEFGQPAGNGGTSHGYPDPPSGATGTNAYGVNLNGNYATAVGGPYYLTVGPINLFRATDTSLKFQRWLNTDYQPYVAATVEISTDGLNWTQLWINGTTEITDSNWSLQSFDISAIADHQPTVYFRWGHAVLSTGAYPYSGWNIDDVQIHGFDCEPPCLGDLDGDGEVGVSDLATLLSNYETPSGASYTDGDLDGDGDVDLSDLSALVAVYGQVCE